VVSYLQNAGFTHVRVTPSRLLVGGYATAAQVETAFNTQISQLQLNGKTVFVNTKAAQVRSSLSGIVFAVGGLQSAVNMKTHLQSLPKGQETALPAVAGLPAAVAAKQNSEGCLPTCTPAAGGTFTPVLFPYTYDVASVPEGSNTSIAISTYGDDLSPDQGSTVIEDLRNAEASYGMPYVPVEVRLATPIPKADADTSDGSLLSPGMIQHQLPRPFRTFP
jgi:subtilase family serine protease